MKYFSKYTIHYVIPVIGKDLDSIKNIIKEINSISEVDIIEIRLDYIEEINDDLLKSIRESTDKKIIATYRCDLDGGKLKSYSKERINYLISAVKCGFDIVDIEFNRIKLNKIKEFIFHIKSINKKIDVIVSYHNFKKNLKYGVVKNILKNICSVNPDLIKIAFRIDNRPNLKNFIRMMFDFKRKCKIPLSLIGLGKYSKISRLLATYFRQNLIFLSLKKELESAQGQINYKDYFEILNLL